MSQQPSPLVFLPILMLLPCAGGGLCTSSCGGIPLRYPLGVDTGCGSPRLRGSFECTPDYQLLFRTPSGGYRVQSVDYRRHTMIVYDPALSTCNSGASPSSSSSADFFLLDTQYAAISPTAATFFVLFNCSGDSPLFRELAGVCAGNVSGHACEELFGGCPSLAGSLQGRCCFTHYSTLHYKSMGNLLCSEYTAVYDLPEGGVPEQWPTGMKMSFSYPDMGCPDCLRSGGECGFDTTTLGFSCLCADSVNTTTTCPSSAVSLLPPPLLLAALLFLLHPFCYPVCWTVSGQTKDIRIAS